MNFTAALKKIEISKNNLLKFENDKNGHRQKNLSEASPKRKLIRNFSNSMFESTCSSINLSQESTLVLEGDSQASYKRNLRREVFKKINSKLTLFLSFENENFNLTFDKKKEMSLPLFDNLENCQVFKSSEKRLKLNDLNTQKLENSQKSLVYNLLFRVFSFSYPYELLLYNLESFQFQKCHFSLHVFKFINQLPAKGTINEVFYYFKILTCRNLSIVDTQGQIGKILELLIIQKFLVVVDKLSVEKFGGSFSASLAFGSESESVNSKSVDSEPSNCVNFSEIANFFTMQLASLSNSNTFFSKIKPGKNLNLPFDRLEAEELRISIFFLLIEVIFLIIEDVKFFSKSSFYFKNFYNFKSEVYKFYKIVKEFKNKFKLGIQIFNEDEFKYLSEGRAELSGRFLELELMISNVRC